MAMIEGTGAYWEIEFVTTVDHFRVLLLVVEWYTNLDKKIKQI